MKCPGGAAQGFCDYGLCDATIEGEGGGWLIAIKNSCYEFWAVVMARHQFSNVLCWLAI